MLLITSLSCTKVSQLVLFQPQRAVQKQHGIMLIFFWKSKPRHWNWGPVLFQSSWHCSKGLLRVPKPALASPILLCDSTTVLPWGKAQGASTLGLHFSCCYTILSCWRCKWKLGASAVQNPGFPDINRSLLSKFTESTVFLTQSRADWYNCTFQQDGGICN